MSINILKIKMLCFEWNCNLISFIANIVIWFACGEILINLVYNFIFFECWKFENFPKRFRFLKFLMKTNLSDSPFAVQNNLNNECIKNLIFFKYLTLILSLFRYAGIKLYGMLQTLDNRNCRNPLFPCWSLRRPISFASCDCLPSEYSRMNS